MRILAKVAYKGTNYKGWEKQVDVESVQETIEKVLSKILNEHISIYASGRTDAGVHAIGQYFHFDTSKEDVDLNRLRYSVNCLLPKDISITSLVLVNSDFHARYNVKSKTYTYIIRFGERNVFNYDFETNIPFDVDVGKLEEALNLFEGKHNFQDFNSKEEDEDNFVRTIEKVTFIYSKETKQAVITFKGDGFMRYQIRDMIGSALAVAEGKEDISFIKYHLTEDKNREIVSYKAAPNGLFLVDVEY